MEFAPIWKDTYYANYFDGLKYYIKDVDGDAVIYQGYSKRMPGNTGVTMSVNSRVEEYLNPDFASDFTQEDDGVIANPDAVKTFQLRDLPDSGLLESYKFIYDWSYEDTWTGQTGHNMSTPINGHLDSRMKMFCSIFNESASTFDWEIDYRMFINISPSTLNIPFEGGEFTLNVTSNNNWSVQSKPSWVNMSPTSGTGSFSSVTTTNILVNAGANAGNEIREGDMIFSLSNGTTKQYRIKQQAGDYLTFEIVSGGTITWTKGDRLVSSQYVINYSINGGNWTSISSTTAGTVINVSAGDKVSFSGSNERYSTYQYTYNSNYFGGTATWNLRGNIMSLIDPVNFPSLTTLNSSYTFTNLFRRASILDASGLKLPATGLTNHCYDAMFSGCYSLVAAPELPATTLAEYCYCGMFASCRSLTKAPELPATTLANDCYFTMFSGCYSLVAAPELPATTLAGSCYSHMFVDCTSLTKTPELPAPTLTGYCYVHMFSGCTNLNEVTCLATDISAYNSTAEWLIGVSATGTFTKAASMSSWTGGDSGIPSGWTVVDYNP